MSPEKKALLPPQFSEDASAIEKIRKPKAVLFRFFSFFGWLFFFSGFALMIVLPLLYLLSHRENADTVTGILKAWPGWVIEIVAFLCLFIRFHVLRQLRKEVREKIYQKGILETYGSVRFAKKKESVLADDFKRIDPYRCLPDDYGEANGYWAVYRGLRIAATDVFYSFIPVECNYRVNLSSNKSGFQDIGRLIRVGLERPTIHFLQVSNFLDVPTRPLEKTETEWVEFNRRFHVFCDDPQFVFYILTPQFMEKLVALNDGYPDKYRFSLFIEGKEAYVYLYKVFRASDAVDIRKPIDEETALQALLSVSLAKDVIDILKLYQEKYQNAAL